MKKHILFSAISACFFLGCLFYAFMHEYIIIRLPLSSALMPPDHAPHTFKKNIVISAWKSQEYMIERRDLLWSTDTSSNCCRLLNAWCAYAYDEGIISKNAHVDSAIITPKTQELYLSFDCFPFSKKASSYDTWMIIESILKTLRDNKIPISRIHFLVDHQPFTSSYLDFSQPWPLEGFC